MIKSSEERKKERQEKILKLFEDFNIIWNAMPSFLRCLIEGIIIGIFVLIFMYIFIYICVHASRIEPW